VFFVSCAILRRELGVKAGYNTKKRGLVVGIVESFKLYCGLFDDVLTWEATSSPNLTKRRRNHQMATSVQEIRTEQQVTHNTDKNQVLHD
jgi:hypothetical protein